MTDEKKFVRSLCIDFDGVIHSYTSGWQGADVVADPPVEGAIEWLTMLVEDGGYEVNIYSSRSKQDDGIDTMMRWLLSNGMAGDIIPHIQFPTKKPAAWITIDDRCICFNGTFPTKEEINNFTPWNKKRNI
jgi:hypothetical protein